MEKIKNYEIGATSTELASDFTLTFFNATMDAYEKFGIYPCATLAQGMLESDYGRSTNARLANNLFGVTASGSTNEYWDGTSRKAATGINFRVYSTPYNSIMDFARLIASKYPDCAKVSMECRNTLSCAV